MNPHIYTKNGEYISFPAKNKRTNDGRLLCGIEDELYALGVKKVIIEKWICWGFLPFRKVLDIVICKLNNWEKLNQFITSSTKSGHIDTVLLRKLLQEEIKTNENWR